MKIGDVRGLTRGTARIYARAREMRVSPSCEINCFATKHSITRPQARELIERIGGDKLNAAARAAGEKAPTKAGQRLKRGGVFDHRPAAPPARQGLDGGQSPSSTGARRM